MWSKLNWIWVCLTRISELGTTLVTASVTAVKTSNLTQLGTCLQCFCKVSSFRVMWWLHNLIISRRQVLFVMVGATFPQNPVNWATVAPGPRDLL
jgi:hypothetical protein